MSEESDSVSISPDWRNKPFGELTKAEIGEMEPCEYRWYLGWLIEQDRRVAPVAADPVEEIAADDPRFDGPNIATMKTGIRIWIYPGEHEVEGAFAGEKLPPLTEHEVRSNSYVSGMWDRSQVIDFSPQPKEP